MLIIMNGKLSVLSSMGYVLAGGNNYGTPVSDSFVHSWDGS